MEFSGDARFHLLFKDVETGDLLRRSGMDFEGDVTGAYGLSDSLFLKRDGGDTLAVDVSGSQCPRKLRLRVVEGASPVVMEYVGDTCTDSVSTGT